MEPITHALASVALGRAGLGRATRFAMPMLIVSGLSADLDWLSYLFGPRAFLAAHRTASHSLVGTAVIAVATTALFSGFGWFAERRNRRPASARGFFPTESHLARRGKPLPFQFWPALMICSAAAGLHLFLDLTGSYGAKLLWPFSAKWYAGDLAAEIDPWILILLLAAVFLPMLFGLITQEIGAHAPAQTGNRAALAALFFLPLYFGGRAVIHQRALALLNSSLYWGETPLRSAAFPGWSPLDWTGLMDTGDAFEELDVPVYQARGFDPERTRRLLKPPESRAIDVARASAASQAFLSFARFPFATQQEIPGGYRIEIRDLRFAAVHEGFGWAPAASMARGMPAEMTADPIASAGPAARFGEVVAVITTNANFEVTNDTLHFASSGAPARGALKR